MNGFEIGGIVAAILLFSGMLVFWSRRRLDHRRARTFRFTFLIRIERTKNDRDETTTNGHGPSSSGSVENA